MGVPTDDPQELMAKRSPATLRAVMPVIRTLMRTWFRSDVRDMDRLPAEGGVLLISNHSGGLTPMDLPIIASEFVEVFGPDRELYCLAHDLLFTGLIGGAMLSCGFLPASRANALAVLEAGAVTVLFPGGDHETSRPTSQSTQIDFNGRMGYTRIAFETGVPIVPVVSIGGQEAQLHLSRGEFIAKTLRFDKLLRTKYLPISFGFPFGIQAGILPPNLPLPTKIVTQVLDPIDIRAEFGDDPDFAAVDELVRTRMQAAMDELAEERRFPVIG